MFEAHKVNSVDEHINVNEEESVLYWANQFECTPESLRIAVAQVGVDISAVREHLL